MLPFETNERALKLDRSTRHIFDKVKERASAPSADSEPYAGAKSYTIARLSEFSLMMPSAPLPDLSGGIPSWTQKNLAAI